MGPERSLGRPARPLSFAAPTPPVARGRRWPPGARSPGGGQRRRAAGAGLGATMDRFVWTSGLLEINETLVIQQRGVRIYDGEEKVGRRRAARPARPRRAGPRRAVAPASRACPAPSVPAQLCAPAPTLGRTPAGADGRRCPSPPGILPRMAQPARAGAVAVRAQGGDDDGPPLRAVSGPLGRRPRRVADPPAPPVLAR